MQHFTATNTQRTILYTEGRTFLCEGKQSILQIKIYQERMEDNESDFPHNRFLYEHI